MRDPLPQKAKYPFPSERQQYCPAKRKQKRKYKVQACPGQPVHNMKSFKYTEDDHMAKINLQTDLTEESRNGIIEYATALDSYCED